MAQPAAEPPPPSPPPPLLSAGLPVQAVALLPGERLPINGGLSHPAWQRAPVHAQFFEHAPDNRAAPRQRSEFRVLFDDQALYVGVRAFDDQPEAMRAPLVRHDHVNRTQDFVALYVDAIGNRQSAQFFRLSAAGSTADGLHNAADDHEDFSPDFDWDGAAQRDALGYTVVFRIPLASLRFADSRTPAWRIMVVRRRPREQFTMDTSLPLPRDAPSFIAGMQPLLGLRMPEHAQFLSVRPSVTVRRERGSAAMGDGGLQASLDLKWRPLPELVVDATWRPDFSQVALDVPQLSGNTRFALYLDEKRPFFFESSDLLRSPTDALYTRSFTEPRAGLRATWRGDGLAGTLMAIADHGGGTVLRPTAFGTGELAQPASQALAGRVLADGVALGGLRGLQLGALAAWRRYADGLGDNLVAGPDATWHPSEGWRLRAQWLASRSSALPDDAGQALRHGPASSGQRRLLKAAYTTAQVEFEGLVDDTDSGFRHDTGFVNQAGVRKAFLRAARGWQGVGAFNELWVNAEGSRDQATEGGGLVARSASVGVWFTAARNLEGWVYWIGDSAQRVAADQPALRERYWKGALQLSPASWFPKADGSFTWGQLADVGDPAVRPGAVLKATLALRPLPGLELEPSTRRAWLRTGGQRVYDEAAGQWLAVWHLDARQALRLISQTGRSQRLAGDGWNSRSWSLTYSWRQSMATVLHVGASRQRDRWWGPSGDGQSRAETLFVKLQVDAQALRSWLAPPPMPVPGLQPLSPTVRRGPRGETVSALPG